MKIEDIFELWKEDSDVDKTEIGDEAANVSKLHHKYYSIFFNERILLRKLEAEFKTLKLEKHEFYTQGPNEETQAKGWKFPAKGVILKADIPIYMDADPEIINFSLRIGLQHEKIDFLDSIIKTLGNRGYLLKNIIDWHKFTMGA